MTAVAFGPMSCSSGLVLRASSCTVLKLSTVLFQNTAFMVAKTSPFGLKNRSLPSPSKGRGVPAGSEIKVMVRVKVENVF